MSNRTYQAGEILTAIQAVEDGIAVIVAAKRTGCSIATIARWRSMYRDFSIAEIERALQTKVEVERLRRDAVRYNAERIAWKRVIQELKLPLYARIKLLGMLESTRLVTFNQGKRMLCIGNTMTALVRFERDDTVVLSIMKEYLAANPSHGLNLMYHQHLKGKVCGFIRAQRIYKGAGLQLYRRNAKRSARAKKRHLGAALRPNATWSMDFMHFRLTNNAAARTLNVLDDFSRECLLIKGGFGTNSALVAQQLDEVVAKRGVPTKIRCDNGPEFIGKALAAWANSKGITIEHIDPFMSYQNGYIERFNGTMRADLFRWNKFDSLEHFERVAEDFRSEYNHSRPHQSLGWLTPAAYAAAQGPG